MDNFQGIQLMLKDSAWSALGSVKSFGKVIYEQLPGSAGGNGGITEIANQTSQQVKQLTSQEVLAALSVSPWIQIAGFFGASAVAMGAFGAHGFYPRKDVPDEMKAVYETANKYHFIHSLALIAVPMTRKPLLCGTLLLGGMSIFCGTCYAHALTADKRMITLTPYGGVCLIIGWLAMLF